MQTLDEKTQYFYQTGTFWGELISDNGYDVVIRLDGGKQSIFTKSELLSWVSDKILFVVSPRGY